MVLSLLKKRNAQSGSNAAILVIIIVVLLILFILSISPEERNKLLEEENSDDNEDSTFPDSSTLFRANPGTIPYIAKNEKLHEFAPFNLKADKKGEIIHTQNSMDLKNSAFEKITDQITFKASPEITSNVLLNFNVEDSSGSLIIKLNGEVIFNAPITKGNSPPISIAAKNLKAENTLTFEVSGPGAAFWRYNYYEIKDINIYGDILDLTQSESTQVFRVDQEEADEIETSTIRYIPDCNLNNVKDLTINVNEFQIFKGIPDCEIFNEQPIPTNYLHEGINELTFKIGEGDILVDRARILNTLDEPHQLLYYFEVKDKYFEISEDEYELKNNYETMLDIRFPNTNHKRFELIINGKPINFNTARLKETRNLKMFLEPGTNSIQINPKTEMQISEIRVRIREK